MVPEPVTSVRPAAGEVRKVGIEEDRSCGSGIRPNTFPMVLSGSSRPGAARLLCRW